MLRSLPFLTLALALVACGSVAETIPTEPSSDTGATPQADTMLPDTEVPAPGDSAVPPPPPEEIHVGRCGDAPPAGARMPAAPAKYSGATCPALIPGTNTLRSGAADRKLIVVVPKDYDRSKERLPLIVMWHHLGGAADSMLTHGQVQAKADEMRFIALVPEAKGDLTWTLFGKKIDWAWPYLASFPEARLQEELTFFDDMLACATEQFAIDTSCVSSVGVSAGALWTAQLAKHRSDRLASIVSMSGGVGPGASAYLDVRGWSSASHALPALIGWGGPKDTCAADFDRASKTLETAMAKDGHFLVECVHNCGHTAPPVDDPAAGLAVLYRFALDHPFWLSKGASPWTSTGLPSGMPSWCAIGAGKSSPRVGSCDGSKTCPVPAL